MDRKEIKDTLAAAQIYLNSLGKLNEEIGNAEEQIKSSTQDALKAIELNFNALIEETLNALNKRKEKLLNQSQRIKEEALQPLQACRTVIVEKIEQTLKLIKTGGDLLESTGTIIQDEQEFLNKSSLLGSLPEVPALNEVPHVSFQFCPDTKLDVVRSLSRFGAVSRAAPAQICSLSEMPGAVLVEWRCVESEDVQEFRLQRAFGNVIKYKHLLGNFIDCYSGTETHFLVRDLQVEQEYSFRVCCKFEGRTEWSPWSLVQVKSSSVKPFNWAENSDYLMVDENKICKPKVDNPSVLFSNGPQFRVGYSVEFTFLEMDDDTNCLLGLILTDSAETVKDLKSDGRGSFLIDRNGEIYVDGLSKSTKLPALCKGSKVCFSCRSVNASKIRINVDCCDKIVTYDWAVPCESALHYAARFESSRYKIMVE